MEHDTMMAEMGWAGISGSADVFFVSMWSGMVA